MERTYYITSSSSCQLTLALWSTFPNILSSLALKRTKQLASCPFPRETVPQQNISHCQEILPYVQPDCHTISPGYIPACHAKNSSLALRRVGGCSYSSERYMSHKPHIC